MPRELTEQSIQQALASVTIPGKTDNLMAAGQVSGIVIKDGHVGFTVEILPSDKDSGCIRKAMKKLCVSLTESVRHRDDDRASKSLQTPVRLPAATERPTLKPARHLVAATPGKGGLATRPQPLTRRWLGGDWAFLSAFWTRTALLPRLIGREPKPQTSGNKIIPIEAWGLQTMSIGYLRGGGANHLARPMVMSAGANVARRRLGQSYLLVIDMPPGTGDAH